ncbi:transglutaminase domain-containing protein [Kibdelosporangium aridum]|uniref:transglutaminase domain-containing protein n=1 Tax=Kibdelosporangium aridum TaxID=2030 RepID=UPI0035E53A33
MTCLLVTPWWRDRRPSQLVADGDLAVTRVVDWDHPRVNALVSRVPASKPLDLLRSAHQLIASTVRPVYALNDTQPVSRTLQRGRGSCSQRLAVLEAVARAYGIPTRVRGLVVDGRFWYPRFRRFRYAVPSQVVLAWPEFYVDETWLGAAELFGSLPSRSACGAFTNADGETLFDALSRTAVDWDGVTGTACDLSATVLTDLGRYSSRDELFAKHGQTLCAPVRALADPVLSRWAPV